ncbi:MAG: GGDEF domain-containing protein [Lachnospiraceae bacterium]|nr:GGDEF domain-containing protein [Lachnospiraceae bacterium]
MRFLNVEKRRIQSLVTLAIVGTAFLILAACIVEWIGTHNKNTEGYSIHKGWNVSINGKEYENVDLRKFDFPSVNKGDVVVFARPLPDIKVKQPVLVIYSIHSGLDVQISGHKIFEYGMERIKQNKVVGYGYNVIPIRLEDQNHYLSIKMLVNEDNAFTSLSSPEIVEATEFMPNFIANNSWQIIISMFLVVFGAVSVLFSIGLILGRNRKINLWKLMWLGAFAFFAGLYSACATDVIKLFTNNNLVRAYMEFETLYMIPVCFTGYIQEEVNFGNKKARRIVFNILVFSQFVFWAALLYGYFFEAYHPASFLIFNHMIDLGVVLFGIVVYFFDWKRNEGKSNWLLFGMLVLAVFAVEEVARFNYDKYISPNEEGHYSNLLYLAAFIFTISLLVDYVSDVIYILNNTAKVRMAEEFAYVDTLTRVGSRHATEEFYDLVDDERKDYCLIEFDLNGLKKVNDTYGHEAGDFYIKSFANALKRALDGSGFIGRTGGDEFVAVLTSPHCLEKNYVEYKLRELDHEIEVQNKLHSDWTLSAAYGYCYSNEEGIDNIRTAFRISDARMYEKKRSMKVSRE